MRPWDTAAPPRIGSGVPSSCCALLVLGPIALMKTNLDLAAHRRTLLLIEDVHQLLKAGDLRIDHVIGKQDRERFVPHQFARGEHGVPGVGATCDAWTCGASATANEAVLRASARASAIFFMLLSCG